MTKVNGLDGTFGFAQGRLEVVPFPKQRSNRVFPQHV